MVEVRAVHDEKDVYFAFRWEDPSRSLRRLPLIKQADGWHLPDDNAFIDDVNTFYEDKFAVIFSPTARFGSGGVAHFGSKPIANEPGSRNGRDLHYTDGPMVDMWQWKPSRGGMLGHVDNMYMAPPRDPTPDEASQLIRYQGGYWGDPGRASYVYNFLPLRPSEYHPGSPVAIRRLPKDYQAMTKAMGHWDPNPDASVDDGSQWWMLEDESVPYSPEADAKILVGTIIPGVLIIGDYEGPRAAVTCRAHWQDGHWTLITKRSLKGASTYDQDFAQGHDLYMWVAVFDHTQTRHTRHPRPVKARCSAERPPANEQRRATARTSALGQRRKFRLVTAICAARLKPDSALAFMSTRPRKNAVIFLAGAYVTQTRNWAIGINSVRAQFLLAKLIKWGR